MISEREKQQLAIASLIYSPMRFFPFFWAWIKEMAIKHKENKQIEALSNRQWERERERDLQIAVIFTPRIINCRGCPVNISRERQLIIICVEMENFSSNKKLFCSFINDFTSLSLKCLMDSISLWRIESWTGEKGEKKKILN